MSETVKPPVTDPDAERRQIAYDFAWKYAQLQKQVLQNLQSNASASVTYTRFSKENILNYMQTPKSNEKNIRNASIYMFDISSQYRRLIQHYAHMPLWAYTITPLNFDPSKVNSNSFRKAYIKVAQYVETMNIKHEMQKAFTVAFREGVLYGVRLDAGNSFFIQRINPDICKLSSIVDGTWQYAVDFSQIKEDHLGLYPEVFTTMWNDYKNGTATKWQEIPEDISFCLKADETTPLYSLPSFASTLPMLYDIETFKAMQETSSEISNYKLIGLEIPTDSNGEPQLDWDLALQYYQQLVGVLPPYVGVVMSPMKMSSINFEKGGGMQDIDTVSRAEEQFWREGGTSPLLFGSSDNDTAGALRLAVTAGEEIVLGLMTQAERLFNKILKQMSGSQKFKINILPATRFNYGDLIKYYKEASTFGIPVKSAYSALLGLAPLDVMSMDYIEMNILDMGNLTPLKSSHTQSSRGRPAVDDGDLGDAGQQTRDDDTNANR